MTIYAELAPDDPTKIQILEENIPYRYTDVMKTIPTAYYKKPRWLLNKGWLTANALTNEFGSLLTVSDELRQWMSEYFSNVISPAYAMRDQIKADEVYEGMYPHQNADVQFLSTVRRGILANGMGSGKSRSALYTLRYMRDRGEEVFPTLIVAPSSTKYSWKREAEAAIPGVKAMVIDGTAAKRKKQFKEFMENDMDIVIMNWESVKNHSRLKAYGSIALARCPEHGGLDPKITATKCEVHDRELQAINFKSAVGDEIHRITDPKTKVARAFKYATQEAGIKFAMSGTPILSAPEDLFSCLNWLDPKEFPSRTKFIDRYFNVVSNAFGGTTVLGIKPSMEKEFFLGIDPILRRMPKEVILPFLPPVVRETRHVEMTPKQKKAYNELKEKAITLINDEDILRTATPLTQMMRLLQFASAYGTIEERPVYSTSSDTLEPVGTEEYLKLSEPSSKLNAFMEDLPDFGDSSLVVFASSKQLLYLLAARLDKNGIQYGMITGDQDNLERQKYMDAFQAGSIKLILVSISAGGTGITLTRADTMVYLQRSWSMVDNLQSEGRAHRIGSEIHDHINIIDYVTEDTVENLVFNAIERKTTNLEYILRDQDTIRRAFESDTSVLDVAPASDM